MQIMPYNFLRNEDGTYLLSNMTRDFIMLQEAEFFDLLNESISNYDLKQKLIANHFICETDEQFNDIIEIYRSFNSGLFKGTFLHIFVLTLSCNLNCVYCQAASKQKDTFTFMTKDIAKSAVDIALQSIDDSITFEFQGGEPLANFEVLKYIIEYTKEVNTSKKIYYSLVTNTGLMTDSILNFLVQNNVNICISIDGDKEIHDKNRPANNNYSNFESAVYWYTKSKELYSKKGIYNKVTALPTVTRYTLEHPKEFIDFYNMLGERSISIRELSPYGRALSNWNQISYSYKDFLQFYKTCMDYLIELNLEHKSTMTESLSQMYLKMIVGKQSINYTDLRSPCGAAIGQMAYNWNGDIYTCDEGRMMSNLGMEEFKIGNVFHSSYKECITSDNAKCVCSASGIESNPDRTYSIYNCICGVCPVYSFFTQKHFIGNVYKQDRCKILSGKFNYLVTKLTTGTSEEKRLLQRWGNCE